MIILKQLNSVTRAGMKMAQRWNRCFWKIEQAESLLTNLNSRLQSGRNQRRLAIFLTSERMDETPKLGGIQKNHGNAMITSTLAPRSENMQRGSRLRQALLV